MERNWTKRKLLGLYQGDTETVRQWQSQYGRFIYTWLYYQLNKDESQAAALTAQTLSQALNELSAFDPEQTTMYLWLKDAASRQLQTVLSQSGLKVQRPGAWSEIPAKILDSLKRIRNEALIPDISGCGAVTEMVQSVLADLSEQDRDLLIRRYTRLDTVENIAADAGLSAEKVNQQLYLARHAFRRGLFFLMQSANPDAVEPTVSGATELFESNLEALLRSVNAAATMSSSGGEQIKRAVLGTASEIAQNPNIPVFAASNNKILKMVFAGAGVLILTALMIIWFNRGPQTAPSEPNPAPQAARTTPDSAQQTQPSATDQEELKRVLDMGVRGDVAGLLSVLKTGGFVSQMTAAHYLGQLGDETAIPPLRQAQARWYPDDPMQNPFSLAIDEIEDRLAAAASGEPVAAEVPKPAVQPEEKPQPVTPDKKPLLAGRILDYSGSALSGVLITLLKDNPAQNTASPIAGFSATADQDGHYAFETLPEGPFVVAARDPQRRIADTRRMVWPAKDTSCTLDFGGPAAISGAILFDSIPLAEQMLMLSDRFNYPSQGVFTAETQTDAHGGFVFTGVPAGFYGLFSRYVANRWTLLAQVEVAAADVVTVLDHSTVTLVAVAEELPEPLSILAVSLRYSPDSSDTMAEWIGVRTEVDTVFEINRVIPGAYTLCVDFSNGVRIFRDVVVSSQPRQDIFVDQTPSGKAGIAGRFLSPWPEGLTFDCGDPHMRIGVMPEEDGNYELSNLPSATYSLGTNVNGLFVPFLDFGLFEDQPAAFDPDPAELAKTRSPLYIFVTDDQGRGLSSGQVWLAGDGGFYIASPFGRGYFVVAPPGGYTLAAVFSDNASAEQQIALPASSVQAPQTEANTRVLRIAR